MVLALNSAVSVSSDILASKSPNLFSKAVWLAIRLSNLSFMLVRSASADISAGDMSVFSTLAFVILSYIILIHTVSSFSSHSAFPLIHPVTTFHSDTSEARR